MASGPASTYIRLMPRSAGGRLVDAVPLADIDVYDRANFSGGSEDPDDVISTGRRSVGDRTTGDRRGRLGRLAVRTEGLSAGRERGQDWRARRRRIVVVAAFVVVAGLGIGALVAGQPNSRGMVATISRRLESGQYPLGPPGAARPGEGDALALPAGTAIDVAISDTVLYVLLDSGLDLIDPLTRAVERIVLLQADSRSRLLVDSPAARLWIVDENAGPTQVREFDSGTLALLGTLNVPATVFSAAAVNGRLFLATADGVEQFAPGSSSLTGVTNSIPVIRAITADPSRQAVLGLSSGPTAGVITVSADGATLLAGPGLGLTQRSTVAVIDGTLWVSGVGATASLARLDPASMHPVTSGPNQTGVISSVGGTVTVTPGAADLWVYSPSTARLYCVDDRTGQELQHWDGLSGPVTAGGRGPFAVGHGHVLPLVLRGACQG